MKIVITSILVDDQDKALNFYTGILGFIKKHDIPMGGPRWLTVVSPEDPEGTELLLEPDFNPLLDGAAQNFKKALFEKNIPCTSFGVVDIQKEYERLQGLGVVFKTNPTNVGPVTIAVFDDTCGNLVQIAQNNK